MSTRTEKSTKMENEKNQCIIAESVGQEVNEVTLLQRNINTSVENKKKDHVALNVTNTVPVQMDVSAIGNKGNKINPKKSNTRRRSMRNKPKIVSEQQKVPVVAEESKTTVCGVPNISSTIYEEENKTVLEAQPMEESINDLCNTLSTTRIPTGSIETPKILGFDSARKPSHRRTMFDVSMDIISERLQNINRSARRSVMSINTLKQIESPTALSEKQKTFTIDMSITPINNLIKKKRKLFVPNNNDSSLLFGTPPPLTSTETSAGLLISSPTTENPLRKLTPRIEKKRRRTIMNSSQTITINTKKEKDKKSYIVANANADISTPVQGAKLAHRRRTLMPLTNVTCDENDIEEVKNTGVVPKPSSRNRQSVISLTQSQASDTSQRLVNNENTKCNHFEI